MEQRRSRIGRESSIENLGVSAPQGGVFARRGKRALLIAAVAALTAGSLASPVAAGAVDTRATREPSFDVLVHGGTVFDGTGGPGRILDVGVTDGRISSIGDLSGASSEVRYDATGLYVAPGFIDVHAHTDTGDALALAKSALTQGVTTETLGPDGVGRSDIAGQLAELDATEKGINVAPYVGFNTVWADTVGAANVRPTQAQIETMQGVIRNAMAEGAWGVSSGLGYPPARFAETDEVIAALQTVGPWRAMFSDHMRDETNFVVESTQENLAIGAATGLMAEATHMKVAGPLNWGESATLLQLQADARANGNHAGGDVYPYTAAQTGLSFYIPSWAQDGGTAVMLDRFADPIQRARIDAEVSAFVVDDVGVPENIAFPALGNTTLREVMLGYGGVTIGEAVMRVLEEHEGDISAVMQIGSEGDLTNFLQDPFVAISSDGGVTESAATHPRHYGTYPRVLGRYVRELGVLSWEEAIRKMTGLPATMLGMVDRGFIAEGMAADITVFDPNTIIDRATFAEPKQYAEGVRWVFVNGALALDDGEPTGAHSGLALRRASSMPTRPQNVDERLTMVADGTVTPEDGSSPVKLNIALSQRPGEGAVRGAVVVHGPDGAALHGVRYGVLQTAEEWSSVTGIGRDERGAEHAFVIIVDGRDPLAAVGETRVTIQIDGVGETYGSLSKRPSRR
ncbi:N-acyl-D-amino-acid deacylase family protein [Agromyces subbeticus]|uniref:N-acyl-D-amino-acid deacylase family protein n=1 Tax=Agromyces subbeticus TaxID=293890 RepID=UPI0003B633D2|nr:amidohydrolase family protein [Agromyces subbeticus]